MSSLCIVLAITFSTVAVSFVIRKQEEKLVQTSLLILGCRLHCYQNIHDSQKHLSQTQTTTHNRSHDYITPSSSNSRAAILILSTRYFLDLHNLKDNSLVTKIISAHRWHIPRCHTICPTTYYVSVRLVRRKKMRLNPKTSRLMLLFNTLHNQCQTLISQ